MCLLTALTEITSVFKSNEMKVHHETPKKDFRPSGPGPEAGPLSSNIIVLQDVDIVQHHRDVLQSFYA